MMPNASMSGMQLARWLESQLDNQVHTIDDVLARARYQLDVLKERYPAIYITLNAADWEEKLKGWTERVQSDGESAGEEDITARLIYHQGGDGYGLQPKPAGSDDGSPAVPRTSTTPPASATGCFPRRRRNTRCASPAATARWNRSGRSIPTSGRSTTQRPASGST